jgi:hypothetical protein
LFDFIAAHCGCEITARSFRLNSSGISIEHPFVQRAIFLGLQPFGSPTTGLSPNVVNLSRYSLKGLIFIKFAVEKTGIKF